MKREGIRVIDLSVFLLGPYLTLAMADHGAEVIKVEPPAKAIPPAASVFQMDQARCCASRRLANTRYPF